MTKPIVIFDIDGTLSDCSERRAKLEQDGDFHAFEEACEEDKPNNPIIELLITLASSRKYRMYIVSGRKEKYRKITEDWLVYHAPVYNLDIAYDLLLMRADDDNRCDTNVKREMVKYFQKDILFVVDDCQKVVDMWRSLGITCLQCTDFKG